MNLRDYNIEVQCTEFDGSLMVFISGLFLHAQSKVDIWFISYKYAAYPRRGNTSYDVRVYTPKIG